MTLLSQPGQSVLAGQDQVANDNVTIVGDEGLLQWTDNWVLFEDTMLQMTLLSQPGHSLCLPTRIKLLMIMLLL